ncbi:hypothetical protein M9H77_30408 [Catharanthus roseus]|uniref:Uncharacterized protein n=1 Tax=Catharanthus roseus TaxID=4058 RepID=A0ACC0A131_CATRO|nr:hypothetical protein M9H77_30408 [Catharanthus roseus]
MMKKSRFIVPQEIPSPSGGLDLPPNRYGIKPGRHWDSVDRQNDEFTRLVVMLSSSHDKFHVSMVFFLIINLSEDRIIVRAHPESLSESRHIGTAMSPELLRKTCMHMIGSMDRVRNLKWGHRTNSGIP